MMHRVLPLLAVLLNAHDAAGFALAPALGFRTGGRVALPRRAGRPAAPAVLSLRAADDVVFVSESAKKQLGNDAFLNKDLMARAQNGPGKKNDEKLKIGIVGAGLAGMVAAMDLADAGHEVEMFELRPFVGGKVSSWQDKDGNHIEMGLHVFFGCYYNLFGIMKRTGSFDKYLRLKDHIHTFVNEGGHLGALDFQFPIGAPVSGLQVTRSDTTPQSTIIPPTTTPAKLLPNPLAIRPVACSSRFEVAPRGRQGRRKSTRGTWAVGGSLACASSTPCSPDPYAVQACSTGLLSSV